MSDGICFAELDVHARKTAAAAVQLGSGEVWKAQLPGSSVAAIEWLKGLPGPVRAVYEAGPTGFELARAARAAGVELMVCAPGAIPRQPGDRIKTDTRDALKLARLHAPGQLRSVAVPAPELEALRDLVRAREDLRGDLMRARHRISKLVLRHGLIWTGPGEAWAQRHLQWLSKARFEQPLLEVVFGEHLTHHEVLLARRERLDGLILEQSTQGPWAPAVARLRCLRGIDTLTAVGLIAEVGDIGEFSHPKYLASYLGLVPSEHSSGSKRRQGVDHQSRVCSCPQAARRGGLALPPSAECVADAQAPPEGSATRSDRGRVARAATAASPLGAPRRVTSEEAHDRCCRGRPRTRVLRMGDRPTGRLSPAPLTLFGVGVAAGAASHGTRDEAMSTNPARSFLDSGPGAAKNRLEVTSHRISA